MPHPETWTLADGTPMALRVLRPTDAPALNELIDELTPQDRRRRFHGAVGGVSTAWLTRMASIDPQRELALVVTAQRRGRELLVADARCVVDETGQDAEFALMVASGWRRRGVGQRALLGLAEAAAERGLHWLYGSVLSDNLPMLALVRRCGFLGSPHRGDRRLTVVERRLQPAVQAAAA
ncbi:MAG: GNAT family N-acetyltransferase [Piscinibacter sp.]|nr:GNAT family N-acetyltransferase [Piscinibacter sp.]